MTIYLNRTLEKLVREGDVEGVVVTGLTLKGVELLEQALNRYGDVQTASLVMSYIVPKRFKDSRVEDWVEK
jgi:cytoskeletal protein CcmA (bactofilin family)